MTVSVAEELIVENRRLVEENLRMRSALERIAWTTRSATTNQIAHEGLGHQPNPHTERMLAELKQERR